VSAPEPKRVLKAVPSDPFADLSRFRIPQDYTATLGVQKLLLRVPVRKPGRQEWVRTHPDADYQIDTALIELAEEREFYLPTEDVREALFDELRPVRLFTTITRQNVLILWPCRLPDADGRTNPWHASALDIAGRARERWVRMASNRSLGAYDCHLAAEDLPDPTWPDKPFGEILRIAFQNALIDHADHAVLRRLQGRS
jgi:hypothetical protein